jgi:Glycosyl hydrolase 108
LENNFNTEGEEMNSNFTRALQFTSKWEGGYVNDPQDPGGVTKYGISKRSYPKLDIENLTREQANEIYYKDYWLTSGCDSLPGPLCLVAFDSAVNHGVSWSLAYQKASKGNWNMMMQLRLGYYYDLVKRKPVLSKFLRGWQNRWLDLKRHAAEWESEEKQKEQGKVQLPTG